MFRLRRYWKSILLAAIFSLPVAVIARPVQLVTGDAYPPFADPKLPDGGLATVLVTKTLDHAGISWKLTYAPWKRGYQMTLDGDAMATFPYFRDAEREAAMNFSVPLFRLANVLFVHAEQRRPIHSEQDFSRRLLCLPTGYTDVYLKPWLRDDLLTIHRADDLPACFKLLQLQRVDGVAISDAVGWAAIREAGFDAKAFRTPGITFSENWLHLIVAKENPDGAQFLQAFNQSWQTLVKAGAFDAIVRQHAGDEYAEDFARFSRQSP